MGLGPIQKIRSVHSAKIGENRFFPEQKQKFAGFSALEPLLSRQNFVGAVDLRVLEARELVVV